MSTNTTPRPVRTLITRPVDALGRVVRRAPRLATAAVIAITMVMVVLSGQAQQAAQNEGMMPDVPEVAAAEVISDRFGDLDEEVIQIVVRAGGGSVIGRDGHAAATAIEQSLRTSDAADRIADTPDRPGVVSWIFPAQIALGDTGPPGIDDDQVRQAYAGALKTMPATHVDMAAALLPHDADPDTADRALALVFVDTAGLDPQSPHYAEQILQIETVMADAVNAAELPEGITVEPFSPHLLYAEADAAFESEMGRLFGTAFAIIVLILGFVYWVRPQQRMTALRAGRRSVVDVLLSMAAIVMAIVWMTGVAVLLGPSHLGVVGPMTEFSQVIPILLIGLGVDYAIHLTSRYREELGGGASVTGAVARATGTVGGALVLATVTTALGFLTNIVNPIPALRDFGILSAVGIAAAFIITLTFVPAARLLLDRRAERAGRLPAAALGRSSDRVLSRVMGRSAVLAQRVPVATLAVTVLLAGVGMYGMTQLETRFSSTDFVPDGSPALATIETLTEDFQGGFGETTDILITGDVATPEVHNALITTHEALADVDGVVIRGGNADATSPVTLLASTGAGGESVVPTDTDVPALYAAAIDADPDIAQHVLATDESGQFDAARVQIMTTAGESGAAQLQHELADAFAPVQAAGADVTITSPGIQNHVVVTSLQSSQASSLAITLIAAMLLLVAVFAYEQRRPALGVLTTIPVGLVVLWTFGMMAATDIPFGPITATIAALAIGIGLPYAIHITHRFTEDRQHHHDTRDAIGATVRHAGGAMAGSAFTTMAGFGVLVTSSLVPFRQLGAVTAYAVGFSLIAATLVLPSLLVLWDRWHQRGRRHEVPVPTMARPKMPVGAPCPTATVKAPQEAAR